MSAAITMLLCAAPLEAGQSPGAATWSATDARVAVLDAASAMGQESDGIELLALRRIFDTLGIRCDVLSRADNLNRYRVLFTAGALVNSQRAADLANDLYDYVEGGGVLVSAGEAGSSMYPLYGVVKQLPSRRRTRLSFAGQDPSLAFLTHPRLQTISLGNGEPPFFDEVIWSHGSSLEADATALGLFEDATVGFSVHPYGRGAAYLLGLSYAESVLLPQIGGSFNAERQFANGIEPSADAIMLLLKAIWADKASPAVCLASVPYALPTALVLTHDVDAQTSFVDSRKFAALEATYGAKSTVFVATKYFTDASDIGYFNVPENLEALRELQRQGWDIGSHTVSHSFSLASAPDGDSAVTRATYNPLSHITVSGEATVSKELLDGAIAGQTTLAFRSGGLAFPRSLIRILAGAGYRYDSTFSANAVLSAFPFMALEEQALGARESRVVEIPVTLDDSQGFLTAQTLSTAVRQWTEVLRANARYGGITVLLIHPSDTRTQTYKLQAQEGLMKEVAAMGGWMGDLSTLGRFWASRAALRFSTASGSDGALVIRVDAREADLDPSLGFEVGGQVGAIMVTDSEGKPLDFKEETRDGKRYLARPRNRP